MGRAAIFALIGLALPLTADQLTRKLLDRLAEEASTFATTAPNLISEETLRQKAQKTVKRRFHPRIDEPGAQPAGPEWQSREIHSEYGYAAVGTPPAIHEMRKVLTVDGKTVNESERAVRDLVRALKADDDKSRKRLLEDFEKHGLVGTVTDFGPILLLFGRASQERYSFSFRTRNLIGAQWCDIFTYRQVDGPGAITIWDAKGRAQPQAAGEIWVARDSYRVVRITIGSTRGEGASVVRDEAQVDYDMSTHGVVVPVAVTHREYRNGALQAENLFTYAPFRRFGASADIKFTEEPKP